MVKRSNRDVARNYGECVWPKCKRTALYGYQPVQSSKTPLVDICAHHWTRMCLADTKAERHHCWVKMGFKPQQVEQLLEASRKEAHNTKRKETKVMSKNTESKTKKSKDATTASKRQIGTISGGSIGEAWVEIFTQNEKRDTKKLTDEQIHVRMNKDFPGRTSVEFADAAGVAKARRSYNAGWWNGKVPPKVQSHSYDEEGNTITSKSRGRPKGEGKAKPEGKSKKTVAVKIRKGEGKNE